MFIESCFEQVLFIKLELMEGVIKGILRINNYNREDDPGVQITSVDVGYDQVHALT